MQSYRSMMQQTEFGLVEESFFTILMPLLWKISWTFSIHNSLQLLRFWYFNFQEAVSLGIASAGLEVVQYGWVVIFHFISGLSDIPFLLKDLSPESFCMTCVTLLCFAYIIMLLFHIIIYLFFFLPLFILWIFGVTCIHINNDNSLIHINTWNWWP